MERRLPVDYVCGVQLADGAGNFCAVAGGRKRGETLGGERRVWGYSLLRLMPNMPLCFRWKKSSPPLQ
jgi:hypothetical protein